MITGELKSKIDRIWEAFWSGGISNPLTVIEQITYLLFIRRLDEIHSNREKKANFTGKPIENPIFTDRNQHFRWSRFRDFDPERMHKVILTEVFPFIKTFHDNGESSYTKFMSDAIFIIPTPALLDKVVGMLDDIPMEDRDTKGDLYEYLLSKLNTAGQNGQFRTPRHIIRMMVDITAPKTDDIICDPASGTCGFLMSANEYVREHYKANFSKKGFLDHYNNKMFTAFDFDSTMLRIGAMNMLLHGIENPHIENRDSLSQEADFEEAFTLILANPPFKGSLDYDSVAKNLLQVVKTKKTELLFLALFIRLLKTGGRCACIVPDGVLFGSSNAHKQLRKILVDDQKLEAVISMPSGVFKPYAGVSTAVLIFTKTKSEASNDY